MNNTLSLICGTGLDSNPQATVTWMAPDGTTIMDNARYDLENGPEFVRLNFTHTILSDTGTWKCRVVAMSEQYIVSGGMLVQQDSARIGEQITVDIELTVISKLPIFLINSIYNKCKLSHLFSTHRPSRSATYTFSRRC